MDAPTRPKIFIPPKPVNYIEKAKSEMKWIEEIQDALEKAEAFQRKIVAANFVDELGPIVDSLRQKLAARKESFQKYFDAIDTNKVAEET